MEKNVLIKAEWDSEAKVWVAESDDVPGLVTEAGDMEQLVNKLKILIPELLEINNGTDLQNGIPFCLRSEYTDIIYG